MDVDHVWDGEGGAVMGGLHPGDGASSLQENVRTGSQAQLGSLLDPWVPP